MLRDSKIQIAKESIASINHAAALFKSLPAGDPLLVTKDYAPQNRQFSLSIRWSSVRSGSWFNRKAIVTQGLTIRAHIAGNELLRAEEFETYVRPSATDKQRIAAISRAYLKAETIAAEFNRRAPLINEIEAKAKTILKGQNKEKFLDAIETEEARRGKLSDYQSMTYIEAKSWLAWIESWKA